MNKQNINGLVILDKPVGPSSNAVLQEVKRLFKAKKVGHTGALDPLASGMLPLCFGETTKFSQYLLNADKCYRVTGRLGIKTTTSDALGSIISEVKDFNITKEALVSVVNQFLGTTKQCPSMFSALKHKGQPLYKLARQGIEVDRESRDIHIEKMSLEAFDGRDFTLEVHCSKGTYIRNLVEDIGEILGTHAHVIVLRRVYIASLQNEKMVSLEELKAVKDNELEAYLLPIDRPIDYLPKKILSMDEGFALQQGKTLNFEGETYTGLVRLYNQQNHFIGLGELEAAVLRGKRLVSTA